MTPFDLNQASLLWRRLVERKEHSVHASEQSAILAGIDIDTQAPTLIPQSVLHDGHVHISGRTGSGKTASTLMSMAFQILRDDARREEQHGKNPLVIIDLKGDRALFNAMRQAAAEHDRTFRYFSTHVGDDYHFFDPMQLFNLGCETPMDLASEFVRAFSLDYGLTYGGLYFTHQNLGILLDAVHELVSRRTGTPTLDALSDILDRMSQSRLHKDARHIHQCVKFLAEFEQVNIESQSTPPTETIDMLRVLEEGEVVYFYLELEGSAPSLRQIASLALYTLVQAAKERRWRGLTTRSTYVIIDEFYHIAGSSFGDLLSTVRHLGLHFVMANQTRDQLESHDKRLPSIVEANSAVQMAFSFTIEEAERFAEESGRTKEFLNSYSRDPLGRHSISAREAWTTRLSKDELQFVNDTRLAALLFVQDGSFHAGGRVRKIQTLYPIPKSLYDFYGDLPLPRRKAVEPSRSTTPAKDGPAPQAHARPHNGAPTSQIHQNMKSLWEELVRDELVE